MTESKTQTPTAAIALIGNELLSGKITDLSFNRARPKLRGLVALAPGATDIWGAAVESMWAPLYD